MPQMSPEVMQALARTRQGGMAGMKQPPKAGPAASPMMTPQNPAGQKEGARVKCLLAAKLVTQALTTYGIMDETGKGLVKLLKIFAELFGKQEGDSEDMVTSEKKTLAAGLAPQGAAPQKPPGAPPGMPPGPPGAGGVAPPMMPPGGAGAPPPMGA
jgi:hypothetical protein